MAFFRSKRSLVTPAAFACRCAQRLTAYDVCLSAPTQVGATVALSTLGVMVGADGDGVAVLDELHSAGLPARLLQELAEAPHRALLQARLMLDLLVQASEEFDPIVSDERFAPSSAP